ncbi:hypothetical protein ID866_12353 [Astraeus odoratus]|nr:hypothetical protein ID866_12353 [Astraeus odoratus]
MADNHYIPIERRLMIPEIGGSQAGFIGLVVFLSVLILVFCVAVFYLLRYHEPTEQGRAVRRERHRRHRAELNNLATSEGSSLGEKVRRVWNRIRGGKRQDGRGWIQTGSGDEWGSNADPTYMRSGSDGGQMQSLQKSAIEIIRPIVESPSSKSANGSPDYCDPFTGGSPVSQMSSMDVENVEVVRSQSPTSVGTPRESDGNDEERNSRNHYRDFSTLSSTSGTRFLEHV